MIFDRLFPMEIHPAIYPQRGGPYPAATGGPVDPSITGGCPACLRAAENPLSGIYQSNCMRCTARQLAQGPEAKARERDPSALQAAMRRSWPDQSEYQKGRALVWEFINRFEGVKA